MNMMDVYPIEIVWSRFNYIGLQKKETKLVVYLVKLWLAKDYPIFIKGRTSFWDFGLLLVGFNFEFVCWSLLGLWV